MKLMSLKNKNNGNTRSSRLYRSLATAWKRAFRFVLPICLMLLLTFMLEVTCVRQINALTPREAANEAGKAAEKAAEKAANKSAGSKENGNGEYNKNSNGGGNFSGGGKDSSSGGGGGGAISADKNNQGNNQNNNNQNQGNNQNQNQNGGNNNSNGGSNGGGGGSGGGSTCGGAHTFFDWGCNGASDKDSILTVLVTISNWLAAGVVIAVIGGIIYGAIMYATSAGDVGKAKSSTEIIKNAFIALVLYFLMWAFLQYIVPGGLFG